MGTADGTFYEFRGLADNNIIKIVSPARSFDSVNSAQDDRDSMNLNDG